MEVQFEKAQDFGANIVFLLIKLQYIIIIGLGIWAIYHYREPIMDFYHRKPLIDLVIGFFSVILLITGIAIAETPSSDTNSSKTEKVVKSSDDSDENIDESDEDDFDGDVDDSSSDNDVDDESDNLEETSSDEDYDTDEAISKSDTDSVTSSDDNESSNEVSSSSIEEVSSTQEGDWTVAGPGMVFVSDSNLYYSKLRILVISNTLANKMPILPVLTELLEEMNTLAKYPTLW